MSTAVIDQGLTDRDLQVYADELVARLRGTGNGAGKGFDDGTAGPVHDKAWWDEVFQVVGKVAPVVIGALAGQKALATQTPQEQKNFWDDVEQVGSAVLPVLLQAIGGAGKGLAGGTEPGSKAWYDQVMNVVGQLVPVLTEALAGQKSLNADDKSFWSSVLHVVTTVAPYVVAAVV